MGVGSGCDSDGRLSVVADAEELGPEGDGELEARVCGCAVGMYQWEKAESEVH